MATFFLKDGEQYRETIALKDSATVIPANSFVTQDAAKEIIPAVAASTALAFTRNGAGAGETEVDVSVGTEFTVRGTADAAFALTDKGISCDITDAQLIDLGATATTVVKVGVGVSSGVVGATTDVEVRINKPIF